MVLVIVEIIWFTGGLFLQWSNIARAYGIQGSVILYLYYVKDDHISLSSKGHDKTNPQWVVFQHS